MALQRAERAGEVAAHAELDASPAARAAAVADEPRRRVQLAPDVDAQRGRRGLPDVGHGAVGDLEHPPRGGEEALPGRGERDPAAVALEEAAEPGLEPRDALGERLLGEVQRLRRPPEVPVVDHRHERPDLREIEIHATTVAQPVVVIRATKLLDGGRAAGVLGHVDTAPTERPTLYEHAGGEAALHRLEQLFYDSVLRDPLLQPLFGDGPAAARRAPDDVHRRDVRRPGPLHARARLPAPHRRPPRAADHRGAARALRRAVPGRARRGGLPDDEPFRAAVREHVEFGTRVAMQNSNADRRRSCTRCARSRTGRGPTRPEPGASTRRARGRDCERGAPAALVRAHGLLVPQAAVGEAHGRDAVGLLEVELDQRAAWCRRPTAR